MVRLKSRYILFEVLYPTDLQDDISSERSRKDILLQHHKASSAQISTKSIVQELRRALQYNFGDYGAGRVNSLLQMKYFSNRTSTGIIRCGREDYELVVVALTLMNKIDAIEGIILNPVKVSGTIKRIEQHAIRRNERVLAVIQNNREGEHFKNVSEDDAQD
ncbi:LAME_0B01662g1_1 [Lachancea meyersii CBS 8951]|uniref:Ribonuclease P/MRP protein subunit POP5 n=1 Tax=Lachancea meyersii CBS 8951 TaxID=1266667 RepID=A0A1G4ITV1_9SACH|nr:LAME_0B01662g1_1 [Lachancea meyersii CBS 8951]